MVFYKNVGRRVGRQPHRILAERTSQMLLQFCLVGHEYDGWQKVVDIVPTKSDDRLAHDGSSGTPPSRRS